MNLSFPDPEKELLFYSRITAGKITIFIHKVNRLIYDPGDKPCRFTDYTGQKFAATG
jgi:hypothetical protein